MVLIRKRVLSRGKMHSMSKLQFPTKQLLQIFSTLIKLWWQWNLIIYWKKNCWICISLLSYSWFVKSQLIHFSDVFEVKLKKRGKSPGFMLTKWCDVMTSYHLATDQHVMLTWSHHFDFVHGNYLRTIWFLSNHYQLILFQPVFVFCYDTTGKWRVKQMLVLICQQLKGL